MFDWPSVKTFKNPPELSELQLPVEHVREHLYRLGTEEYAATVGRLGGGNRVLIERFVWSPTFAAVRGIILSDPGCEDIPRVIPPAELLLKPGVYLFEDMVRVLQTGKFGQYFTGSHQLRASIFESTYIIAVGRLDYYFSSGMEDWNGQKPILICLHTSDERWDVKFK